MGSLIYRTTYSPSVKRMKVKLISVSQPIDPALNPIDLVAYCARVSNPENQSNVDTSSKLLSYLKKHQHWSPFEMANAVLEITTTRDIARQILRHRSFSFQEFSQRYAEQRNLEYREARLQDQTNRQNSVFCDDPIKQVAWANRQAEVADAALDAYEWAINTGIAKEQARAVLPEGMTESVMYVNGTLRSWLHYVDLREGPETQLEHREVAQACRVELAKVFPELF